MGNNSNIKNGGEIVVEECSPLKKPYFQHPKGHSDLPTEHNGPKGLEPTRYGDWEKKGRCIDF